MNVRRILGCASVAVSLVLVAGAARVEAQLSIAERKCLEGLTKEATKFVQKKLKTIAKCNDANLKLPGDCPPAELAAKIAQLETKVRDGIGGKCVVNQFNLLNMGFPGKCTDLDPGDGFLPDDLEECIATTHEARVDALIGIEYGTTTGPLASTVLKCQQTLSKNIQKYAVARLKLVQKCRNDVNKGKLAVLPVNCATADVKTSEGIAKADSKARAKIAAKCTDADIAALDVCDPSATTVDDALDCLIQTHADAVDTTDLTIIDLIDIEYAAQPACGDGVRNQLDEECDGGDDDDCVDECGSPSSTFPCLCLNVMRQAIIEDPNADLDNGWTGISHDSGVVDGGGYILDLYDCDNTSDFLCTVGPSCEVAPHPPCFTNAQCQFFGLGDCRRRRTAQGPKCSLDISQPCTNDGDCPGIGNFCDKTFHGPPLPLSAGGTSVCVLNVFSEDLVGTTNLATGDLSIRMAQKSLTYIGPVADQPCPVCGGFCAGTAGEGGPGARTLCSTNADCPNPPNICVTDLVCSYGPSQDLPCRPQPPFGGPTQFFGTTSADCAPEPGANISGDGLTIVFDPLTTGTTTKPPTVECDAFGFNGQKCVGGPNEGQLCSAPSDCPMGTCNELCFCPGTGSTAQKPNRCSNACRGGMNNGNPCSNDGQCTGGFCEFAPCRHNVADTDSSQEGFCPAGPTEPVCSSTYFKTCASDADCNPPLCVYCTPGETCTFPASPCFVASGISRSGSASASSRTATAIFCIPTTESSAINSTAGVPGPGAITQPADIENTGF